jgi:muramoyltetrapeptide carboxypeptidase
MPVAYLCCPAYPLAHPAQTTAAVALAERLGNELGWRIARSPLLDRYPGPGAWLPPAERAADLQQALACDILLAARGGYGCLELSEVLTAHGGPWPTVIGYSDLTVIHAAAWRAAAPPGIYGFMPAVTTGPRAWASTVALLTQRQTTIDTTCGGYPVRPGLAAGRLFPACLRVLTGLIGTPLMPDLRGAILALEDIDERPYRTDRDLQQLWLSGALSGITGLLLGRFPCTLPVDYAGPRLPELSLTWAERLGVPVVAGVPFGHETDPVSLGVGCHAQLTVEPHCWSLTMTASAR